MLIWGDMIMMVIRLPTALVVMIGSDRNNNLLKMYA